MRKCILLIGLLVVILFTASNANAGNKVWYNVVPYNADTVIYTVPTGATVDLGNIIVTVIGGFCVKVILYKDTTILATLACCNTSSYFENFSFVRYSAGQQIKVRVESISGFNPNNTPITITGNQLP